MATQIPTSLLFLDGTNLDHRLDQGIDKFDVDFPALFLKLSQGTQLLRAHYFTAHYVKSQNPEWQRMRSRQSRSLNRLRRLPDVSVHTEGRYQTRTRKCGHCRRNDMYYEEKGTDVHAASMLVRAAAMKLADTLIFVANDNDYAPAFTICAEFGQNVTLAYVMASPDDHHKVAQLRKSTIHRPIVIDKMFMSDLWLLPPV